MHPSLRHAALGALLALGTACAGQRTPRAARQDREVISQATIQENRYTTAWDAVQALHSNWLQPHGTDSFSSPTQVWVYVDNVRVGGVDALRELRTENIGSIRHLDSIAATSRFGVGHGQGAIVVTTTAR